MTFSEWLAAEKGRLVAAAAAFRVSKSAISQWAKDGVPLSRMRAVSAWTGGAVSLEDMVPLQGTEGAPAVPAATSTQPGQEVRDAA